MLTLFMGSLIVIHSSWRPGAVSPVDIPADRPKMPEVTRPVLFNTPEADKILAALQVFREYQELHWTGTFAAYAQVVRDNSKVTRSALQNAASIGGMVLSTEP